MMSILDNLLDATLTGSKYMHLVPTSTVQPMTEDEVQDMTMDDDFLPQSLMSLFGSLTDKAKGCHDKMKQMMGMSSSEEDALTYDYEQAIPENAGMDYIYIDNNNRELADETVDSSSLAAHENDNLLLVVMGVIMILVMICGVCYAGRRFLMDRKERNRMDSYQSMEENDKF